MSDFPEDLTDEAAQALIDQKTRMIYALIEEATDIAEFYSLRFVLESDGGNLVYEGHEDNREGDDGWDNSSCW